MKSKEKNPIKVLDQKINRLEKREKLVIYLFGSLSFVSLFFLDEKETDLSPLITFGIALVWFITLVVPVYIRERISKLQAEKRGIETGMKLAKDQ